MVLQYPSEKVSKSTGFTVSVRKSSEKALVLQYPATDIVKKAMVLQNPATDIVKKAMVLQNPSEKVFKKHWFYSIRPKKY